MICKKKKLNTEKWKKRLEDISVSEKAIAEMLYLTFSPHRYWKEESDTQEEIFKDFEEQEEWYVKAILLKEKILDEYEITCEQYIKIIESRSEIIGLPKENLMQ